jgi:hypothetical protein
MQRGVRWKHGIPALQYAALSATMDVYHMHRKRESGMLEGKFGNCQVDEVLQTIVQGKGAGRLSIKGTSVFGGRVRATFFIEDSHIVHVEAVPGTNYHPLVDLFSLREGSFVFVGGERLAIRDQSTPVSDVVLQVTAALDEWNSMRQQIGSVDGVFALRPDGATKDLTLRGDQWQVMARLDGKASIRDITNATNRGTVDVVKVVHGFVDTGLAAEAKIPAVAQDQESSQLQRRGFFGLWSRK